MEQKKKLRINFTNVYACILKYRYWSTCVRVTYGSNDFNKHISIRLRHKWEASGFSHVEEFKASCKDLEGLVCTHRHTFPKLNRKVCVA